MGIIVNRILLVLIVLLPLLQVRAQGSKEIREKGIKSQTVYEYFIEEGIKEPVIESKEVYNEAGDIVELIEYNREGEITLWEKYSYDEDRNLVEQSFLNSRGNVEKLEKTIYEDGLRVERQFFDGRGRMYKRKVYEYEYRK